jgi:hypothetical protein
MAKTLKDILEVAKPVSPADKAFVAKHTIKVTPDANKNGDDVFKGKTKAHKRSPNHGYDVGADEKVYEAAKASTLSALTGKASPIDDYTDMIAKFKAKGGGVTKVAPKELDDKEKAKLSATFGKGGGKGGSALATGEFASMNKTDAAYNAKQALARRKSSGILEKTLTPNEKSKREEIATAIKRENPSMPMGKKMAIATAQAKKVAEETDLDEALKYATVDPKQVKAVLSAHRATGESARHMGDGKIAYSGKKLVTSQTESYEELDEAVAKDHYDMHHKRAMSALNDIGKHLMKQKAMCDKSDNKWAHQDNAWAMKDMSRQLEDMMQNSAQRTENMMPVPTPKDSIRGY